MRYGFLAACFVFCAGAAGAQTVKPIEAVPADRQVLEVHVGGRVVVQPAPDGGATYVHQWPGVYFESRFEGRTVYLAFSDAWNEYRLLIDDLAPITIAQPGEARLEVTGLAPGGHRVRLEKVTESIERAAAFDGFSIPAGETALPVTGRARQIEFIGDSSLSGYGNRSTKRNCTGEEVFLTTDTQQDMSALTAKHFDADYQINAISGRGLIRNYGGVVPEYAMSKVYPFVLLDKTVPYDDPEWQPQIIVVKLDADFATPLNPGEAWVAMDDLQRDYTEAQMAFARMLHDRYPKAAVLVFVPQTGSLTPEQSKALEVQEQAMNEAARKIGIPYLGFVPLRAGLMENTACDYHASLADHRILAADLIGYIDAHPDLWQGR